VVDLDPIAILTRAEIRAAMRRRADTLDIARVVGVTEAQVWNTLAETDEPPTRGYVVMRQPQRESA
jgi:hypothetical protein